MLILQTDVRGKIKGKAHPTRSHGGTFSNFGPRWGWVVKATPWPLHILERNAVSIAEEGWWASGPVWTGAENLAPTGIQSPHRPARSKSLYRLSYPGPRISKGLLTVFFTTSLFTCKVGILRILYRTACRKFSASMLYRLLKISFIWKIRVYGINNFTSKSELLFIAWSTTTFF
jgi:hypothetical protein